MYDLKVRNETKAKSDKIKRIKGGHGIIEIGPDLTIPEKNYLLLEYDAVFLNLEYYSDTCIQFGYMTMFAVALPVACFACMASNYIKTKLLAYKSFKVCIFDNTVFLNTKKGYLTVTCNNSSSIKDQFQSRLRPLVLGRVSSH